MRPPGQTSRKGAGLGANKRRAGPGGWRRAPLARAHHPPSGGPMSGAVVGSSARGTWRASGAYPQCPNHPGRWGEPADTIRKAPGGPSQQHRTQILAVETSCNARSGRKSYHWRCQGAIMHLGGRCVMMTWSPTHLQPVGVPCCQRSYNHPGCRNEKNLDGFGVFSSWPLLGLGLAFPGHPWILSTKRRPLAVSAPPSPAHMSWQLRSGSDTNGLAISSPRARPAVARRSRVPGQWCNAAPGKPKRGPGAT